MILPERRSWTIEYPSNKKEKENDKGYLGYPLDTMYEVVNIESQGEVRVKRVSDDVERDYVIPREYFNNVEADIRERRGYLRFVRNTGRGLGRKKPWALNYTVEELDLLEKFENYRQETSLRD